MTPSPNVPQKTTSGIAFFDEGNPAGVPVVLVHGFPFDHTMWRPQIEALTAARSFRVISYDVRGHGQSDAGDGQYSVETFVDDLIGVLDGLKIDRAVLCGLSMGGYIALRAMERNPERFKGLVLCDTRSEGDSNEAKVKRSGTMKAVKGGESFDTFVQKSVNNVLCDLTLRTKPDVAAHVAAMIRTCAPLGIAGTLLALAARTDTTDALKKITVPVLILVGQEDKLTPPAAAEGMLKLIPQAKLHVVPDAAHVSNLENPAVFNAKLIDFLRSFSA